MRRRRRRTGAHSLLTALLACVLSASGCVRFGYEERGVRGGAGDHSGSGNGGQPSTDGGGRGGDGSSGNGSSGNGSSGTGGAGAGGDAGSDASSDSGPPPSDAGATDGGDATAEAGASNDAAVDGSVVVSHECPEPHGWLFCGGFETTDLDPWAYMLGKAEPTTTLSRSGDTALLVNTWPQLPDGGAAGLEARWATNVLGKQKSGHAWLRFYDYLPSTVTIDDHFSVGIMNESPMPWNGFEFRVMNSGLAIAYSIGDVNFVSEIQPIQFPRDRWVCVELHVRIDPPAMYEAYLDGTRAAWVEPVDTLPVDGFSVAEVGIHYASPNQSPVELYVDDVRVATSRIPCD